MQGLHDDVAFAGQREIRARIESTREENDRLGFRRRFFHTFKPSLNVVLPWLREIGQRPLSPRPPDRSNARFSRLSSRFDSISRSWPVENPAAPEADRG